MAKKTKKPEPVKEAEPEASDKKLGDAIDALYAIEARYKEAKAAAEKVEKEYDEADAALRLLMRDAGTTIARGDVAVYSLSPHVVPNVKDWTKFYAWINKNKAPELLQKRVAVEAWRERTEGGKALPGVEPFTVIKPSLRKR